MLIKSLMFTGSHIEEFLDYKGLVFVEFIVHDWKIFSTILQHER